MQSIEIFYKVFQKSLDSAALFVIFSIKGIVQHVKIFSEFNDQILRSEIWVLKSNSQFWLFGSGF